MAHEPEETPGSGAQRGRGRPRKTPVGSQEWECAHCKTRITTHVPLLESPWCTRHTGGPRVMKLVRTVTE